MEKTAEDNLALMIKGLTAEILESLNKNEDDVIGWSEFKQFMDQAMDKQEDLL